MYAIPPNNYDFYTEEEKYVRAARGRGARDLVVSPNDTRARFSFAGVLPKTPNEARRQPPLPVPCDHQIRADLRTRRRAARYKPRHTGDGGVFSDWQPLYEPSTVKEDADRLAAFEKGVPHGSAAAAGVPAFRAVGDSFAGEAERLRENYEGAPTLRLLIASQLHRDEEYGGPFWIEVPSKTRLFELRRVIAHKCGVLPGLQRLTFAGKKMDDAERNLEHYGVKYWIKKFPDWPIVMRRF